MHAAGYWPQTTDSLESQIFQALPVTTTAESLLKIKQKIKEIIDHLIMRENYKSRARGLKKTSKYAES